MCITLWQPWASLIADGYKEFETRSWETNYRGTLLIHAAKRKFVHDEMYQISQAAEGTGMLHDQLQKYWVQGVPYGAIVATCQLTDCLLMSAQLPKLVNENAGEIAMVAEQTAFGIAGVQPLEIAVGLWEPGRFAWKLENIRKLEQPIIASGHQGLWKAELQEGQYELPLFT